MPKHIERIYTDYTYINDIKIMRDNFIKSSFITTENKNCKLHTETISKILVENGFLINPIHTGKILMNWKLENIIINVILIKKQREDLIILSILGWESEK